MSNPKHITEVDVTSGEFKADPFPFLKKLRAEAPVATTTLSDGTTIWLVAKYEDQKILADEDLFTRVAPQEAEHTSMSEVAPSLAKTFDNIFTNIDRPAYTRIRKLMSPAFAGKNVRSMEPMVEHITNELLNAVQDKGEMDIIKDYATALPLKIVLGKMLGVPEEDSDRFAKWINVMTDVSHLSNTGSHFGDLIAFNDYMHDLVKKKRKDLKNDLLSELIRAEEEGSKLSQDELVANTIGLMIGGYDTTVNLIGNAVFALLTHPEQLSKLCQDLSLIPLAVDELLRFTSPVFLGMVRYAREDIRIRGVVIPKNSAVSVIIGSANRDEDIFENPEELDITRKPNPHMGYGWGARACIGGNMANLEAQLAIRNLLTRLPGLALKNPVSSVQWRPGLYLRGLKELPVTFGKSA